MSRPSARSLALRGVIAMFAGAVLTGCSSSTEPVAVTRASRALPTATAQRDAVPDAVPVDPPTCRAGYEVANGNKPCVP
jgi:hypothetical protein